MLPILLSLLALTASAQDCAISETETARLLALPFWSFDQSMGAGWRAYGDRGCYTLAANLLDQYKAEHPELKPFEARGITWHAGQMFAFANDYSMAKERFEGSYDPNEPADTQLLWNDYVAASIAFLDQDRAELQKHRDRIANGPLINGVYGNLNVVDGFLMCFDKPYAVAYGCRP